MATVALSSPTAARDSSAGARTFAIAALGAMAACCLLAGWVPLGVSIVTVFLFAGPHNWMEGRYMLGRMPARWGPLRIYYLTGIAGVLSLAATFAALPWLARSADWGDEGWLAAVATWNSALVLWIFALTQLRSRQNPRRQWAGLVPLGLTLVALTWMWPRAWDLGLVYLHPLVALWFLDRELAICRPQWQRAYRSVLVALPVLLACLWWRLADMPSLPGDDALTERITRHAGAGILAGVSSHLLVATHVFLEMLHYAVWLAVIPLVSLGRRAWRVGEVPLARRSTIWRNVVAGVLCFGGLAVVAIWAGFLANYPLTRDIYFTVAMLHVLAEVPFLLRLL